MESSAAGGRFAFPRTYCFVSPPPENSICGGCVVPGRPLFRHVSLWFPVILEGVWFGGISDLVTS